MPWFHENALLQVDGRDDDLADDGAGCAAGDEQVAGLFGQHTRFDAIALLSPESRETIAAGPER